jgi:uncharacterized membrane protein
MPALSILRLALGSSALIALASSAALSADCASRLDGLEQALDGSELSDDELEPLRQELSEARSLASDSDDEGCSAAAAKLQSAMLQTDGIDHTTLCDRAQSEEDIGEAGMSGNQEVQSALQTSCDYEK